MWNKVSTQIFYIYNIFILCYVTKFIFIGSTKKEKLLIPIISYSNGMFLEFLQTSWPSPYNYMWQEKYSIFLFTTKKKVFYFAFFFSGFLSCNSLGISNRLMCTIQHYKSSHDFTMFFFSWHSCTSLSVEEEEAFVKEHSLKYNNVWNLCENWSCRKVKWGM